MGVREWIENFKRPNKARQKGNTYPIPKAGSGSIERKYNDQGRLERRNKTNPSDGKYKILPVDEEPMKRINEFNPWAPWNPYENVGGDGELQWNPWSLYDERNSGYLRRVAQIYNIEPNPGTVERFLIYNGYRNSKVYKELLAAERRYREENDDGYGEFVCEDGKESSAKRFRERQRSSTGVGNGDETETGDDYVTTDLHEHHSIYMEMLKQLRPNDRLWILGDVIFNRDGESGKGIYILLDIAERAEKADGPYVNLLLGNHDVDLKLLYESMKQNGVTLEEMRRYIDLKLVRGYDIRTGKDFCTREDKLFKDEFERKYKTTVLKHSWSVYPQDLVDFFSLSAEKQEKIYQLLKNAPYFVTTQIGEKKIALVHALPPEINFDIELVTSQTEERKRIIYHPLPSTISIEMGLRITDSYIDELDIPEDERNKLIKRMIWGNSKTASDRWEGLWNSEGYKILRGHVAQERISGGNLNLGELFRTMPLYCIQSEQIEYFRAVFDELEEKCIGVCKASDLRQLDELEKRIKEGYRGGGGRF